MSITLRLKVKGQKEISRKNDHKAHLFQMHTFGRRLDGYFPKYRLHCWMKPWARFDATREGKNEEGQQQWQLHVSCKVHNTTFMSFGANIKGSFYSGNLPLKVRIRVFVENDCSYRVEENETFERIKISSSPWFRSIGEAIVCFRYVSFRLRGSLGEEWRNKRATHRTRISPSLFFLR